MIWILAGLLIVSLFVNVRLLRDIMSLDKFDGEMIIEETEDRLVYHMELTDDPEYTLEGRESVAFRVVRK